MTTLVLNYSQSLLDNVIKSLKNTLKALMIGYMVARQTQANTRTAELISKYEYNGKDYWLILNELNQKTIKQIHEEFGYND